MNLLLDTHIFLWFAEGNTSLSRMHRDAIEEPENTLYLSVVSTWEATIKYQLGKLVLPDPPDRYFPARRRIHAVLSLDVTEQAVQRLTELPSIHKDPFDRMLVCQALEHRLILVTDDQRLRQYSVPTLPA